MKKILWLYILLAVFIYANVYPANSDIRLNSLGYLPNNQKKASIIIACTTYNVRRVAGGTIAHTGNVTGPVTDPDSGQALRTADFSSLTETGNFYLDVPGVGQSVNFEIKPDLYNVPYYTAMRGMYLWRASMAVSGTHNSITYSHPGGHFGNGDEYYSRTPNSHVYKNGTGGWYDAGDYGRYVVNAGITMGFFFKAWDEFKPFIESVELDIPESGGALPDYLAELKYETDWLLKMQYWDGSGRVHHKLTTMTHAGWVMPEDDTNQLYFTETSSAATADFVAIMAMAARAFQPYDLAYSTQCLNAAWNSYNYLTANLANDASTDPTSTGGYGTTDPDDRLWAAVELWETTGDAAVHTDLVTRFGNAAFADKIDEMLSGGTYFNWDAVETLASLTYLTSVRAGKNAAIITDIQNDLTVAANNIVTARNTHGYGRTLGSYYFWGSNGHIGNQVMILLTANKIAPNANFIETSLDGLNYIFGRNYNNRSFVTGMGEYPPMNPHDRRSAADGIVSPWPGYVVGGSSTNVTGWNDDAANLDTNYSYNEIAINWQAPLVYALAAFSGSAGTPTYTMTPSRTPTSTPYAGTPTFTSTATPVPTAGLVQAACGLGETFNIDGNLNEPAWQTGAWTSITRSVEGAAGAVTARFKVRWDNIGLLVGVEVTDPAICSANATWYQDDSIEIYLDVNNNGTATYGADDYQLGVRYNDPVLNVMPGTQVSTYFADSALITGGYSVEYDIPWSDFGVTPLAGLTIGFDIGVNHDETCGGTRTGVLMWNGTANNWTNTSAFGEAVLLACGSTPTFTPTATRTRTYTPVNTQTFTATRTSTQVNTPTATSTVTLTGTRTAVATNTNTPTITPTFTLTRTNTPVNTATSTRTSTPTNTRTVYQSPTDTPTGTLTTTGTPPSATFTASVTQTCTNTPEDTATLTYTNTPVNTATLTFTNTPADTATMTWTSSPVNTFTRTVTTTHTTVIFSPTFTRTFTPTFTRTQTLLPTVTFTRTQTLLPTATLTYTHTSLPPATLTYTQTATATITQTPVFTQTPVPAIVWPCPLNPGTQDLYVGFDVTAAPTSVKFKVYTKSFRLIKSVELLGTMASSINTGKVDRQYLQGLSNGLYYYVIESRVNGGTVRSKIKQFIILR